MPSLALAWCTRSLFNGQTLSGECTGCFTPSTRLVEGVSHYSSLDLVVDLLVHVRKTVRIYHHQESSPVPFRILYLLSEGATRSITQSSGHFLVLFVDIQFRI
jgi:hypothetical protein